MRVATWLQAGIGVSAIAFSGVAAAQGRGPGPFAGSFSVASNTTVSVTSPMAITEERTTRERLEIGQGSRSDLSVQVSNDLGERCTLSANRSGDTGLSFGSGQRCTFTDSVRNMRMNFTLRSGSGSISGDRLSLSFSWSVASNGGFLSVSGSASQRSSGNRTGGHAVADTAPVEAIAPAAPVAPVAPSYPLAVVAAPAVEPMLPMTGAPSRTPARRPSSTAAAARPRASAAAAPVVVAGPAPVVPVAPAAAGAWGSPTPAAAPMPAAAGAWGSPTPAPSSSPVASAWSTPSASTASWGSPSSAPLPVDANTPGAIVLPSGWILGPLISPFAAAASAAPQAVGAWVPPAPSPPSAGVPWGSPSPSAGAAWAPSSGGPGVVLGASAGTGSQGFGVAVGSSATRQNPMQTMQPGGAGPGIVFSGSP